MKRIALILLGAIIAISASAQIYHTTSSFQTIETAPKIHPKFEFYVKVGANIMNADWTADGMYWPDRWSTSSNFPNDIEGKSKFGIDVTFGFMSHFRPSRPSDFYWGAELAITQVGGGFDEFSYSYKWYTGRINTYNFPSTSAALWGASLSPTIGWKKEIVDNISLDLHFNPGILCGLGKKSIYYDKTGFDGSEYFYGQGYNAIEEVIDVSLKGGIGLWFNKFNIDFSYRGLIRVSGEAPDFSNLIISLGYKF